MSAAEDENGGVVAQEVYARLHPRRNELTALLGELVRIESPSDDLAGLDAMADQLVARFAEFGPVERHRPDPAGPCHLVLSIEGADPAAAHVAVLGHYDTVWPRGTIDRLPCTVADGVLTGPGCFDMKGGLTLLYFALQELRALDRMPRRPLRILFNGDEEVRSHSSRPLIETVARGAAAAYVLESPLPGGGLKTARNGIATYRLRVTGRAVHAGIEPEKGASAILELAQQVPVLHSLTDRERGTTVNVGVISGGTRPNVVAAHAEAHIDVRTSTAAETARVDAAINALRSTVPGTELAVEAEPARPPMEPTDASRALFAKARAVAAALGVDLAEGSTGGASDANFVAAIGVPALDGLGPEGDGAHADHEHVLIESLPRRAALLAGLLASS